MKTYKIISVLLVFVILLSVCGCTDAQTEQSKSEQSETESAPEYSSVPETPIEDFEIGINEDGEAELTHYFGGDETVRIPAYFEGKPIRVIHMYAFLNNHKVKTIIFPETARRVKGTGFDRSCDSVERIVLNEGLEEIAAAAFRWCSSLETVNLPESLKEFGQEAFFGCTSLKNINLLPICFESGESAFAETALESVIIPEGVTEIPRQMFAKSKIKSVTLPSTLKTVNAFAFYNCPIESLSLPEGLTTIKQGAFFGARFKEVTLPASVVDFREDTFGGNENMERLTVLGSAPIDFYGLGPVVTTPVHFFEIHYNEGASGFTFPRWNGFPTRIIGSDKLPIISGDYEYLESDGGTVITAYLADDGDVIIPEAIDNLPVVGIGDNAFRNKSLHSVKIPDSAKSIGKLSFSSCDALADIRWPDGLKAIGDGAFSSCGAITEIVLPEGVESIGSEAFLLCSELTGVKLPESIKYVGDRAFSNNNKLKEGVLLAGVEYGTGVYSYCFVERAVIEEGVTVIPDRTFDDSRITEINIPSTVKTIGSSAFRNANFEKLLLPEGVEELGYMAFGGIYELTEVVIPASVKDIHDYTFNNCRQLEAVTFLGSAPNVSFLEDDPDNPYDDDDRSDNDFSVRYYKGATGFDGEYWQELGTEELDPSEK